MVSFYWTACQAQPDAGQSDQGHWKAIVDDAAKALRSLGQPDEQPSAGCWGKSVHDDLLLAGEWPRQEFRDVLLELLSAAEEPRFQGAVLGALIRYDDPRVDKAAQEFLHDNRAAGYDFAPFTVAEAARALAEPAPQIDPFEPASTLLPPELIADLPDVNQMNGSARHMTVPVARVALRHASLSVRLQAWLWLAGRHGIVMGVAPLRDAWPQLTEEAHAAVLESLQLYGYRFRTDTAALNRFIGQLLSKWDGLPARQRRSALALGGRLRIPAAKERAIAIIEKSARRGWQPPQRCRRMLVRTSLRTILQWRSVRLARR